ncbi:acetylcholine receptor subunit alpha-like 1 isoform X2 [Paramacrobiotus metropolitanus]|uniref:acetylcholine receptor subunit alpha-like 1 isoform X2 n=1 Tax=Paramacrobiotus metropolitanus TaxID=2943436 RepID=UPI0024456A84|nr:acetylcholine receptor subunit alpha-like 1 isoform X2 [Paramacrobiotus metropolitanus]
MGIRYSVVNMPGFTMLRQNKDCTFLLSFCLLTVNFSSASLDAERLYSYLMRDYNKLVRPVVANGDVLELKMSLKLTQLIGVDEVNQVLTTNMIVRQKWNDYKLSWNPDHFGGINYLDIPSENIWLPDVVLYFNAEGTYQITTMTKLMVNYTGDITWEPPVIYKSYCPINVTYFPYDKQTCKMKFGSWTYDASLVNLTPERGFTDDFKEILIGMDLSEYKPSIEWDILEASAMRRKEVFSYGTFVDITYTIEIRRKALFYTVNLMIPCVLISFLTVFVFYLPIDSGEKVTLCISILLSLTVFILLLAEIIPPTSLAVPLMGRYLLFTLIMVTCSIAITILVINVHFRNPSTHIMRPWIRRIFIDLLPKLLLMDRPPEATLQHIPDNDCEASLKNNRALRVASDADTLQRQNSNTSQTTQKHKRLNRDIQHAVDGINFVVEHVRTANKFGSTVRDWKYVAMVLDRLFLWIFAISCVIGTGKIILDAPALYEVRESIPKDCLGIVSGDDAWFCVSTSDDNELDVF